jgi:SSS family solute:Na+ symporter
MNLLGLSPLDWIVLVAYFLAMVAIAVWARRRIRNTRDFYQGDRSFGKILIAFLNFGNMTDAGQTAAVTREVYRQGLSGTWFQSLVLFHTPFQWFIAAFQRRARYIGPADIYLHRFESKFLAALYAFVILVIALYANAQGYNLTGKTLQAMLVKPAAEYTVEERRSVDEYREFQSLKAIPAPLPTEKTARFESLQRKEKDGEIRPFISYLHLTTFYLVYALLIVIYTIIGGLFAIAVIDVVQGVLILFLSLALIPAALEKIGGFAGMHEKVPSHLFDLFGSSGGDYTWYFVASLAFLNLVVNAPKSFTIGGSARDDRSARIGMVSGSITKRFMMVAWAFTGLLAVGLYGGEVADPTNVWGYMTRDLLGAGALGLMLAAIFSANMDGNSTISLDASAAVVKNIILPLAPSTSERTQVITGRVIILVVLLVAVPLAAQLDDIFVIFKYILSVGTIVGPSIWLAYVWRRLTTRAVAAQMILSILLTIIIPNVVPITPWANDPALTVKTVERSVERRVMAKPEDVTAGRATSLGQEIVKTEIIAPRPIFFETIETDKKTSRPVGKDLFRTQIWILSWFGIDFTTWSKAGIMTAAALFDAILPFIVLICLSLVTKRNSEGILRDFYARIHTPAVSDPDLDAKLVQEKIDNPELVEKNKIFPGTDWEFWRPTRFDTLGCLVCLGFVGVVIGLYMMLASLGG